MAQSRAYEVQVVDEFLRERKRLQGPPPQWRGGYDGEVQAIWLVEDSTGVLRAQLRFRVPLKYRTSPSISLIVKDRMIWRFDIIDGYVCKPNPPSAQALGLPGIVTGSHEHRWIDNRDLILAGAPFGQLPHRRPTAPQIRKLPQAFPTLAANIGLEILPEQRDFDIPPATDLFGIV